MNLTEKSAYIKGLAEGLDLNKSTAEGKLIAALIDLTSDLSEYVAELEDELDELRDYAEELDEDLGAVEEYLMDEEECDCCDCCDDEFDDEDFEDDGEDEFFEVTCPGCGETICFDDSIDPEDLTCPACNEKFACDIVAEDEE